MTAPSNVTRIHEHVCLHKLFVQNVGWIVTSGCHYGDIVSLDPPAPKLRAS